MYSTPKYKANAVNNDTSIAAKSEIRSAQKIRCESIKSKQKNHRPKSIK